MSEETLKHKLGRDNAPTKIEPTQRLDFLSALAMDKRIKARESLAVRVALVLMLHRNGQTGLICPEHKTIAAEIGCSVDAVKDALNILVDTGWFRIVHRFRKGGMKSSNQYIPNWRQATTIELASTIGAVPKHHEIGLGSPNRWGLEAMTDSAWEPQEPSEENPVKEPGEENSGVGRDAGCLDDGSTTNQAEESYANDNEGVDGPSEDVILEKFNAFFEGFPNKLAKYRAEALVEFRKIARAGDTSSRQIMDGLRMYKKRLGDDPRFATTPARWLREHRWTQFEVLSKSERLKQRVWV
ncbi:helix-turn-helix domain-containing protein [Bradyrhizobium sp. C-145]|uniref:helix-turn-helix domain-containing protein n=1 Tax=Bradyrhizobium sp. C-145 TaxID=574727 RepID=UPI00201B979B|nr:helix-turn-helix domain-containing protein [Bradyrhizobium sp. C-145]UQR64295.1 helix-turn-helix domain-containing protein [Bradyrhizobium sp. C-145]